MEVCNSLTEREGGGEGDVPPSPLMFCGVNNFGLSVCDFFFSLGLITIDIIFFFNLDVPFQSYAHYAIIV